MGRHRLARGRDAAVPEPLVTVALTASGAGVRLSPGAAIEAPPAVPALLPRAAQAGLLLLLRHVTSPQATCTPRTAGPAAGLHTCGGLRRACGLRD